MIMKKMYATALFCLLCTAMPTVLFAQDDPGKYMTSISNALTIMDKTYMSYVSAAAHSKRAKKIERLRQQTIESITKSKYALTDLPFYQSDNSLRKSAIDYVQMCYNIFNDDYARIVNMEEIAEQSVDEMQAYLLLKEKTNEKLRGASEAMHTAQKDFAAKYNVRLIESESELGRKMEIASKVNHYHNDIYLWVFKCNWQEGKLTDAITKKKINDIEQARSALLKYVTDGLAAMDTTKAFEGDVSLKNACKTLLLFYKKECETEVSKMSDFLLKDEEFNKMKKAFESKSNKSKEDVDAYNKAVNELNAASNIFNQTGQRLNNDRNQSFNNWANAENSFMDTHIP